MSGAEWMDWDGWRWIGWFGALVIGIWFGWSARSISARIPDLRRVASEAQFLLDRLTEFSGPYESEADWLGRDWRVHVMPSIARLRMNLLFARSGS